jgi:hypothetical protein
MRASRRRFLLAFLFPFVFLLLAAPSCSAQDLTAAARALGRQIVVSVGVEKRVVLKVQNLSNLSPAVIEQARAALEAELQSQQLRLTDEPEVDATLRVTFSENVENYLLVAEIVRPDSAEVAIVETPRTDAAPATPVEILPLEKTLLLEQAEQILDVAVLAGEDARPAAMLVLEPARVALYGREGARWQFRQAVPITRGWPWPRDLRGRLHVDQAAFRAFLPGTTCNGTTAPTLALECRAAAEAWPVRAGARQLGSAEFSVQQNFFTGKVSRQPGEVAEFPPFFTAATIEEQGAWLWLLAGVDGRVYVQKEKMPPAVLRVAWGSDIASLHSACGGWLVLAAQSSSSGERAAVTAFRYAGGRFVPASRPIEWPGTITALWPAANGSTTIVVSRNPETRINEAYSLSISCGR